MLFSRKPLSTDTSNARSFWQNRGVSLALATLFFFGFQSVNDRNTVLYDYSFMTNTAQRILNGQLPYVDFDLVLPLGSFLPLVLLSTFLKISLFSSMHLISLITQVSSLYLLIRITAKLFNYKSSWVIFLVSFSAGLFSIRNIYPHYNYESFGSILILLLINLTIGHQDTFMELRGPLLTLIFTVLWSTKYNIALGATLAFFITVYLNFNYHRGTKLPIYRIAISPPLLGMLFCFLIHLSIGKHYFIFQTLLYPSKYKSLFSLTQLSYYNSPIIVLSWLLLCLAIIFRKYWRLFLCIMFIFNSLWGIFKFLLDKNIFFLKPQYKFVFVDSIYVFLPVLMFLSIAIFFLDQKVITCSRDEKNILLVFPVIFASFFLSMSWWGSYYGILCLVPILCFVILRYISANSGSISKFLLITWFSIFMLLALNSISKHDFLKYVDLDFGNRPVKSVVISDLYVSEEYEKDLKEVLDVLSNRNRIVVVFEYPMEDPIFTAIPTLEPWVRCTQLGYTCPSFNSVDFSVSPNKNYFYLLKKRPQIRRHGSIETNVFPISSFSRVMIRVNNGTFELYEVIVK